MPLQAVVDPSTPNQDLPPDDDRMAFGVVLEVVDIVTDFVPVISEAKAVVEAIELSSRLTEAHERGDEAAVRELSAQLALTMTDLLPGPNIAGAVRKVGSRADGIPLIRTLKEKLQRLLSKSKGEDNPDADSRNADVSDDAGRARKGEPDNGRKDNETTDTPEPNPEDIDQWETSAELDLSSPRWSKEKFQHIEIDGRSTLTDGKYTVDPGLLDRHRPFDPDRSGSGQPDNSTSVFRFGFDIETATLKAARLADKNGLWEGLDNAKAKVQITNQEWIGVHAKTGRRTNWINIYRRHNGRVHSSPGSPVE